MYVFVDPFNKQYNGVSAYIEQALMVLQGQGIVCSTLKIHPEESIEQFRIRVRTFCLSNYRKIQVIEAPESRAAALYVPLGVYLHVRFHCSPYFLHRMKNKKYNDSLLEEEIYCVKRANIISGPSSTACRYSNHLYNLSVSYAFPNPYTVDGLLPKLTRKYDVVFVGRYEENKGAALLRLLVERNRSFKFLIITNDRLAVLDFLLLSNVEVKINLSANERNELLLQSKVMVVPSLFETFSYVAAEAATRGCKIVCYRDVGFSEYLDDFGSASEAYMVPAFEQKISSYLGWRNDQFFNSEHINREYLKAIQEIYEHNKMSLPAVKERKKFESRYDSEYERFRLSVYKKYKKFKREPRKFFEDSKWFAPLLKSRSTLVSSQNLNINTDAENTSNNLAVGNDETFIISGVIDSSGFTYLNAQNPKFKEQNVCWLFTQNSKLHVVELLEECFSWNDFSPLSSNRSVGIISSISRLSPYTEIIESISLPRKEALASTSIFIAFPETANLARAIKYCNPHCRIIYVDFCEHSLTDDLQKFDFDVYVMPEANDYVSDINFRRFIYYRSSTEVCLAIRRAVHEIIKKADDYFFPIYRAFNNTIDVESVPDIYSAILSLNESDFQLSELTFAELIEAMSKHIECLLLRESTYLRYKNLCDKIVDLQKDKDTNNELLHLYLARLLGWMSKDGVHSYEKL
ncbi:glycosyltransferase [Catenovulum sediminis]|uniref:Glycosyltransferase n=1 Tax=Catenovulum sediminis TaxID=1740262 RepID=A0ABV1RK87_9ALTE